MNFSVDAHIPRGVCNLLREAGHDAIHTSELRDGNRTSDEAINDLSISEQRVVITKDSDFYHSHVRFHRPYKLLFICTGNIGAHALFDIFTEHLPAVVEALRENSLVQLDRRNITVWRQPGLDLQH